MFLSEMSFEIKKWPVLRSAERAFHTEGIAGAKILRQADLQPLQDVPILSLEPVTILPYMVKKILQL